MPGRIMVGVLAVLKNQIDIYLP
jgi:hypothetical protein